MRRWTLEQLDARLVPTFLANQVFPLDNPWNQVVAGAPVAASSAAIINAIVARHNGLAPRAHPDFGNPVSDGALYGIPINVVDNSVPRVNVTIAPDGWADESDVVPVPIPANPVIEGDGPTGPTDPSDPSVRGDSHLLIYDKDTNELWELGSAARPDEASYPYGDAKPLGVWGAWQESYWNLNTNSFRTIGATSADAAGLPIMPGLVRPDEANPPAAGGAGVIDHAIRMTVVRTRNSFVYPASHEASNLSDPTLPRMGERFRLKAGFVIPSTWSPEAQAIAQAMKTYGLIVADNGSDLFFQGTPSDQWNMDDVLQLRAIAATDLEVVDLTPRVTGLSVAAGSTAGGTAVTITGKNFSGAGGQLHVLFGTTEATSVTILSDTQILAVAPAHVGGTVDVRVQSGNMRLNTDNVPVFFGYGTSALVAGDRLTFNPPPPRVTSVVVNDGAAQRSEVRSITVTFDTLVTVDPAAFLVTRTDGAGLAGTPTVSTVNGVTQVRLTFAGVWTTAGSLADGNWTLRVVAARVHRADYRTTVMAADSLTPFTRRFGDANGDGTVDGTDQAAFNTAFGQTDPASLAVFDYNGDGKIDATDRTQFNLRMPGPRVTSVVVNDGAAQRSEVRSITVTFDTLVTVDPAAFLVTRTDGAGLAGTPTVSTVNGVTRVRLTFAGVWTTAGSLADGNWTVRVVNYRVHRADALPVVMAADSLTHFTRKYGDADGNGTVDATDQAAFNVAFGQTDPASLAVFDYNGDGKIDATDRTQFNLRLGH